MQSYGAKIDAIVRYLLHLGGTDPDAKSIVFSQVGSKSCDLEEVLGNMGYFQSWQNIRFKNGC